MIWKSAYIVRNDVGKSRIMATALEAVILARFQTVRTRRYIWRWVEFMHEGLHGDTGASRSCVTVAITRVDPC